MKSGDRERATALRMLVSELKKDAKEGAGDEQAVLRRERKRRLESVKTYEDAGRQDLAAPEQAEAELISGYLPAELSDERLSELVAQAVSATGATSMKDMGAVIKDVMAKAQGQADGGRVSALVKSALS